MPYSRLRHVEEAERLGILYSLNLLDTDPEAFFEDCVDNVRDVFKSPVSVVSLVDADRQWFKAVRGLPVCSTGRDVSFCALAMREENGIAVDNTNIDQRFMDNALVTGDPGIVAYLGMPLTVADGVPIGALAAIDFKPRSWTPGEQALMRRMARQLSIFIEMRRSVMLNDKRMSDAIMTMDSDENEDFLIA